MLPYSSFVDYNKSHLKKEDIIMNTGFASQQTTLDEIGEELFANSESMKVINGGDHQINIWKDSLGGNVFMIQGMSSNVTVLRGV